MALEELYLIAKPQHRERGGNPSRTGSDNGDTLAFRLAHLLEVDVEPDSIRAGSLKR